MGKAYRNNKVGRIRKILEKKLKEVQRPLPAGRIAHLEVQIARLKDSLKASA